MIAWLSGRVVDISTVNCIVLDVNGVGYAIETTSPTYALLCSESKPVSIFIQTIVREDAISLFGFLEQEERSLFRALIKVNGIGPRSAMSILSAMSPGHFIQCVQMQDKTMLTKLPGVGKKTAERIIIEMQDVLKNQLVQVMPSSVSMAANEALSALQALGYRYQEAYDVLQKVDNQNTDSQSLIKAALKLLAKC